MKVCRTTTGILVAFVVLFPSVAPAQTLATSATPFSVQQLITLYTQLVRLLEQEIALLEANVQTQAVQPPATGQTTDTIPSNPSSKTFALICTLTASPTSITAGQTVTLTWNAANAIAGSISPSVASFVLSSGSQTVTPSQTTDYLGTFTGAGGTAYCSALVTVISPPGTNTVNTNPTNTNTNTTNTATHVPTAGKSCTVHTTYCGDITVPNGANAEDTHMCGVECIMEHCDNGVMQAGGTGVPGFVGLSCPSEPYSE